MNKLYQYECFHKDTDYLKTGNAIAQKGKRMISEKTPLKIALWGYGMYGRKTAESMKLYWGGAYSVAKIYDSDVEKRVHDVWWDLDVDCPDNIEEDYHAGLFEKVLICINDVQTRNKVKKILKIKNIPCFFPGNKDDIVPTSQFELDETDPFFVKGNDYSLYFLKNMRGAVADHLWADFMYLFNEEGKIPEETTRQFASMEPDRFAMLPFRLNNAIPERVKLEGQYCVLARIYSANYWHFTFQNADCVSLLEDAGYKGKYIVADTVSNLALMDMLGVDDNRIVKLSNLANHKVYEFKELVLLTFNGLGFDYSTAAVAEISKKVKKKLKRNENASKRLYVKRIGVRRLLNGDEVAKGLGFEIFIPEEHSLKEQMEAFYNADIVLTPHGANSTNCIYMREGAVFAEVFSSDWYKCINRHACEHLGIHYLSEIGVPITKPDVSIDGIRADYMISEMKIRRMVAKAEKLLCTRD